MHPHFQPRFLRSATPLVVRQRGVALVLVLACLVVITILTVAFLQAVRTDLQASQGYSSGANARMLADSALNLVIGQIQEATQRENEAWMSQPGLIRTYNTQGAAAKAYKLYSADQLVIDGAFNPVDGSGQPTDVPTDWKAQGRDVFTDLNEPALRDGVPSYPILNPAALGEVEGFSAPTEPLKDEQGATVGSYLSIPMPVKWLYILKDGTRATAAPGSGGKVRLTSIDSARPVSATNPPVARIAFWTDDEASKININTAGEGTFSDLPIASTYRTGFREKEGPPAGYSPKPNQTVFEADLAWYQPAQREYQRYPGHPATTSLSTVLEAPLKRMLGGAASRESILEEIYKFTPRYSGGPGSSYSGSTRPGGTDYTANSSNSTYKPGTRRLYASTDELLFQPQSSGGKREENPIDIDDAARRKLLDQLSFFLTAHSKSPEQNLFNLPRIAIWPINSDSAKRTPLDKLFAFTSTVADSSGGRKPFYFQRNNPHSATADWLPRNQQLYAYLQGLTSKAVPGFGSGTLNAKFGVDRDQILTEIFDYVRSTNLMDNSQNDPAFFFTKQTPEESGIVIPIEPPGTNTRGFGRYFTLSELALVATAVKKTGANIDVQIALVPEFFCVSPGHPMIANRFRMEFTGLNSFSVGGNAAFSNIPGGAFTMDIPRQITFDTESATSLGGPMGYRSYVDVSSSRDPKTIFPIGRVTLTESATSTISGTVQVELWYDPPSGASVKVQEGVFAFPSANFKTPKTDYTKDDDIGFFGNKKPDSQRLGRLSPLDFVKKSEDDWARSLTPNPAYKSDYRLIAGAHEIGSRFGKHPQWESADQLIHSLRPPRISGPGGVSFANGARVGLLAPGLLTGKTSEQPDIVEPQGTDLGVTNASGALGDFQNAVGVVPDGPTIGRADEGEAPSKKGSVNSLIPYIGHIYVASGGNVLNELEATYFSPNRLIASPVDFGSLSTGVKRGLPWQTLLFRPATSYLPGGTAHPGAATASSPPDHLMLDLFWMPVVEPYPISEPFSTAGKVNLNYQIAPFTNIKRETGLRAVMKSVMITALNPVEKATSAGAKPLYEHYKSALYGDGLTGSRAGASDIAIRHPIDLDATLRLFDDRFAQNKPFISASQVCEIPLVPLQAIGTATPAPIVSPGASPSQIESALATFWQDRIKLTGDNSIERPYSLIYSRVTSKSNTYEVHVRAQLLGVSRASAAAGEFNPATDRVEGEFRGAFLIERYLDPTGDGIVKRDGSGGFTPATETDAGATLGPYKMRVISSKQFSL